jgi:DNA-binding NtrC family response regulator
VKPIAKRVVRTQVVLDSEAPAILVVDSNGPALSTIVDLLNGADHSATGVSSFEAARQLLSRERFDVLVTRLRLQAFNGLHLVAHCQAKNPGTYAIVMNDAPDHISEREARLLGAQYIEDPEPKDILSIVDSVLRVVRMRC